MKGRHLPVMRAAGPLVMMASALTLYCCGGEVVTASSADKMSSSIFHANYRISHVVVDNTTGIIYVGAVNRLYQLPADLGSASERREVVTGPQEDNPLCPPPPDLCSCTTADCKDLVRKPMASVSKALVIDYSSRHLIHCTNLFQGHCTKYSLSDITNHNNTIFPIIVPNDNSSSVVMFIAPGPPSLSLSSSLRSGQQPPPSSGANILYVAATRSQTVGLEVYMDEVPAVCMRNIDDMQFFSTDILNPSVVKVEKQQRDTFRVNYVTGFSSNGFSYFITVQRPGAVDTALQDNLVSRIARVCQGNAALTQSYVEVPLECSRRGQKFRVVHAATVSHVGSRLARSLSISDEEPATDTQHVLVAVLSQQSSSQPASGVSTASGGAAGASADDQSLAICVYPVLMDVQRRFTATIKGCFQGIGNTGPDHIVRPEPCTNTRFAIDDSYCGAHDMNHPIQGNEAITREAALTWTGPRVTAIAVTTTGQHTVAFVGTQNGLIYKILIESGTTAVRYDTLSVDSRQPIGQHLPFDLSRQHIYVTADTKILRLPVQRCSVYNTCTECLASLDPYCGWCTLQSACSLKSECSNSDLKSRWLPSNYTYCPQILSVEPRHVQRLQHDTSTIRLTVQSLPQSQNSSFECVFTGHGMMRILPAYSYGSLDRVNSTLRCNTPAPNLLPVFPFEQDHIDVQLSVRLVGTSSFLTTTFTFYDCNIHTTCTKCTDSEYPCKWCVKKNVCTNHASSDDVCLRDVMITGKQLPGNSDYPGPSHCPRVENVNSNSSEVLVSSGESRNFTVKAVNLHNFQREFKCHFNVDGGVEKPGELVRVDGNEYIRCQEYKFMYSVNTGFINVPFSILWRSGDDYMSLDNPHNVQVRMFNCSSMATNCGGCRRTDPAYECGWYAKEKRCCVKRECLGASWTSSKDICSNPELLSMSPAFGPREGGTSVTITGVNLGSGPSDSSITIGGIPCEIIGYDPFVSYVCKTGSSVESSAVVKGPAVVTISSGDATVTASTDSEYEFVQPVITGFSPEIGPVSGGTRVTIFGEYLNVGSSINIVMTDGYSQVRCSLSEDNQADSVVCLTAPSEEPTVANAMWLTIDSANISFIDRQEFEFVQDPVVTSVSPEKTIISGGKQLVIEGQRLKSVAKPQMIVYVNSADKWFTSTCETINDTIMLCPTPDLRQTVRLRNVSSTILTPLLSLQYGFIMDNVEPLVEYSNMFDPPHLLHVFPDPQFDQFIDGVKQIFQPRNDYLTINGKHLNLVLTEHDIVVKIGDRECHVTSLSNTQLVCKPQFDENESDVLKTGTLVTVTLKTVQNMSFVIGELKIEAASLFAFSTTVILALAGGGAIVLIIIVAALIAYKQKSRESDKVLKRMQNQMDVLEIRVAKECKEAFAELQTDMNEIAGEISGASGIPFRTYRSFCMSVLFPGIPSHRHPVTQSFECDESTSRGLLLFNQLIGNKTFLLLFIRTLENDKEFLMRDKVHVASLLSVALQDKMDYHTDILKTLLAELIERAMESKNHPKLLLRRTDSVAEKMLTNWFTFLLYKFLRDCAGEPLFLLFRAIKQQVDKGPVDMLTGEARYSLSEDKLIRQHIEYKMMTVRVTDPEGQQDHLVRVLDCDSVTQVKEKILDAIYKNTPFSHRPSKEDLELEWHTGQRSRLILKDDDVTTRQDSGFRRVNTLAHYKMTDGAVLALIPRQSSASCYDLSNISDKSSFQHRYDEYFSPSPALLNKSSSPNTATTDLDHSSKIYHLIRPHDSDAHRDGERGGKMVSEIYLARLLTTKVALQQFVDDLFEMIFSTAGHNSFLPPAVKYMFDFLDDQALLHNISDPEIVHTWKSNILPLRFWVNVIKNPDFVFDISKSNIVDSCLSIVAQTFMDCCSMSEHKLSKDSPSSKLLYAKDIPKYRKLVERYYKDIQQMPAYADQDINAMLAEESKICGHCRISRIAAKLIHSSDAASPVNRTCRTFHSRLIAREHQNEFTLYAALYQLYQYTDKYYDALMDVLEEDSFARNYMLASRLSQVHVAMHSTMLV